MPRPQRVLNCMPAIVHLVEPVLAGLVLVPGVEVGQHRLGHVLRSVRIQRVVARDQVVDIEEQRALIAPELRVIAARHLVYQALEHGVVGRDGAAHQLGGA